MEITKEKFETYIKDLHAPLTDYQIKIDRGLSMEQALQDVKILYQLTDKDIVLMGLVYDEWIKRIKI